MPVVAFSPQITNYTGAARGGVTTFGTDYRLSPLLLAARTVKILSMVKVI